MASKLTTNLAQPTLHPQVEYNIIDAVAKQYGLKGDSRNLLFAIRNQENGRQGREFGVLTPEAMRFADDLDPTKSLTIQAMWAAGTIKKRYKGDLKAFAKRYAPTGVKNDPTNLNANWLKGVQSGMDALKELQDVEN